jgi:4-alpha-glucanotransferase
MKSRARYCIIPLQDVLNVSSDGRMNVPSASGGNWAWKLDELPDLSAAKRLAALVKEYDRINSL